MVDDAGPSSTRKPQSVRPITLAAVANLSALRTRVARITSPGFTSPPRLFFALAARDAPVLAGSLRHLEEIRHNLTTPRSPSLPRGLGSLSLGENLVIDLLALPVDETFAPLWMLVLPGAAAVVSLRGDARSALLHACCDAAGTKLIDARDLVATLDVGSPPEVARLLAAALGALGEA
jgi:hypothetical protein